MTKRLRNRFGKMRKGSIYELDGEGWREGGGSGINIIRKRITKSKG